MKPTRTVYHPVKVDVNTQSLIDGQRFFYLNTYVALNMYQVPFQLLMNINSFWMR